MRMEKKTKLRSLGNLTELDGMWEDWKRKDWNRERMAEETERLIKEYCQGSTLENHRRRGSGKRTNS